jgi:hypothetical protein
LAFLHAGDVFIEADLVFARLAGGKVEELSNHGRVSSLALNNSRMIFLIFNNITLTLR